MIAKLFVKGEELATMNILFVCTGNTCRSPMAQALLQEKSEHQVKSAGISAKHGAHVSEGTRTVLQSAGLKYQERSKPIDEQLIDWADLVLTMTTQHKQIVATKYSKAFEKIYTFKEYAIDDEQSTWEQLKQAYLNLEEKRMIVVEENGQQQTQQQLRAFLREEQDEIQRLEAEMPNYDISDPFGCDAETYQKTFKEIEKHVDLLVEKLKNK